MTVPGVRTETGVPLLMSCSGPGVLPASEPEVMMARHTQHDTLTPSIITTQNITRTALSFLTIPFYGQENRPKFFYP